MRIKRINPNGLWYFVAFGVRRLYAHETRALCTRYRLPRKG